MTTPERLTVRDRVSSAPSPGKRRADYFSVRAVMSDTPDLDLTPVGRCRSLDQLRREK